MTNNQQRGDPGTNESSKPSVDAEWLIGFGTEDFLLDDRNLLMQLHSMAIALYRLRDKMPDAEGQEAVQAAWIHVRRAREFLDEAIILNDKLAPDEVIAEASRVFQKRLEEKRREENAA